MNGTTFFRIMLPGLLTAMVGQSVLAQQTTTDTTNAPLCGFGQIRQQYRLTNPDFDRNQRAFEQAIQRQIETQKAAGKVGTVYTLPVVVHVIHTGGAVGSAYNPTDANIQAMIATLNATWRKNGSQYGGVDTQIQFQLATRGPNCAATTGINRVNGSGLANYTSGGITNYGAVGSVDEILVKNLSRWPNTDYINIWIVNKINGSETGTAGYAYLPAFNSALTDGIVVRANVVNGTNKVISHEMGHVFGLSHSFSDDTVDGIGNVIYGNETTCPVNATCTAQGDGVCDTEPHKFRYTCTNLTNECTGAPFQVADAGLNYTVLNNYMGYTNCQFMFTQGQKDRVVAALLAFRAGLIGSGGLLSATVSSPVSACSFTTTGGLSAYYGVQQVQLNTLNVYSNSSQADGSNYIDRTCNQRTTLTRGQTYTLTVTGSFGNYQVMRAYLDYNNNGSFTDVNETVLSGSNGVLSAIISTTVAGAVLNTPLRLRVIANYYANAPTACSMTSGSPDGAGQAEDFTVVIAPPGGLIITSAATGNWNNPATWSCGCVPTAADLVTVRAVDVVTVNIGTATASKLTVQGKISYASGGRLTLTGQ